MPTIKTFPVRKRFVAISNNTNTIATSSPPYRRRSYPTDHGSSHLYWAPHSRHLPDTQSDQAAAPYMDVCDRTDPEACTDLPPFNQMTPVSFTWGESMSGEDFIHAVTSAYAEVVHWRHNLFLLPSGRAGKRFTSELARMLLSNP